MYSGSAISLPQYTNFDILSPPSKIPLAVPVLTLAAAIGMKAELIDQPVVDSRGEIGLLTNEEEDERTRLLEKIVDPAIKAFDDDKGATHSFLEPGSSGRKTKEVDGGRFRGWVVEEIPLRCWKAQFNDEEYKNLRGRECCIVLSPN